MPVADSPVSRSAVSPSSAASSFAVTPAPPYYAVIFTSLRQAAPTTAANAPDNSADEDVDGYGAMAALMLASAAQQDGYLGVESAREEVGITVSYWASLEAIAAWKRDSEHALAQRLGRAGWYSAYRVRISKVEREYGFVRDGEPAPI